MALVYITGVSGAGKSTVRRELRRRGYAAFDTDEDGLARWFDRAGDEVTMPADPSRRDDAWFADNTYKLPPATVRELAQQAGTNFAFVCGTVANDNEIWDLFTAVISLSVDADTIRQRLLARPNSFGSTEDELARVLTWHATVDADNARYGATLIDAARPAEEVADAILTALSLPRQAITVRDYDPADETSWLRCRVLAFLDTTYYDDVVTAKPPREAGLELVAVAGGQVVGLLDASVTGSESTIETIAIHPDHRRLGIGQRLLDEICTRLRQRGAVQVDAWTRDDENTLAWYHAQGFEQRMRYLHVYASTPTEAAQAFNGPPALTPQTGFFHAWSEHEEALRQQFTRVHSCRQFIKPLT